MKSKPTRNDHIAKNNALKEAAKEQEKGLHLLLPQSLHTAFKIRTASNGENMKDAAIKLIRSYVDK